MSHVRGVTPCCALLESLVLRVYQNLKLQVIIESSDMNMKGMVLALGGKLSPI